MEGDVGVGRRARGVAAAAAYPPPRAVIFDLGGTLVNWPDWEAAVPRRWARAYEALVEGRPDGDWPAREEFLKAMLAAEVAHWRRVDTEHWSGPPSGLIHDGFQ